MIRIVTLTRPMVYKNRVFDAETETFVERTSKGSEIVQEIGVTKEGYEQYYAQHQGS